MGEISVVRRNKSISMYRVLLLLTGTVSGKKYLVETQEKVITRDLPIPLKEGEKCREGLGECEFGFWCGKKCEYPITCIGEDSVCQRWVHEEGEPCGDIAICYDGLVCTKKNGKKICEREVTRPRTEGEPCAGFHGNCEDGLLCEHHLANPPSHGYYATSCRKPGGRGQKCSHAWSCAKGLECSYGKCVDDECSFTQDCKKKNGMITDGSEYCNFGNCEFRGWMIWSGGKSPPSECNHYTQCACKNDPDNCFCNHYGLCTTKPMECHKTSDCKNMKKCQDLNCSCQSNVCQFECHTAKDCQEKDKFGHNLFYKEEGDIWRCENNLCKGVKPTTEV